MSIDLRVNPAARGWLPVGGLLLSAMLWGISWWPLQRMQQFGLHPLWTTAVAFGLAVLMISAWQPDAWRALRRDPVLWRILLVSGLSNACFNWGVTSGDVVRVVLLFYLMPVWTMPLAVWQLGEQVRPAGLLRALVAVIGAALVLWPEQAWRQTWQLSDMLGLLAGLGFAVNTVQLRRHSHLQAGQLGLAMFLGSGVVAALLAVLLAVPGIPLPKDAGLDTWPWLALLMSAGFLLGNLGMQFGASRLPATVSSVVMLTEVLWASGSAIWLGAGQLTTRLLLGGALIMISAGLAALD